MKKLPILCAVAQLNLPAIFANKRSGAPQTHAKMEVHAMKKQMISNAAAHPSLLVILAVSSKQFGAHQTHAKIMEYASKTLTTSHAAVRISTLVIFVKTGFGAPQTHASIVVDVVREIQDQSVTVL